MVALTAQEKQVLEVINTLPPERRRLLLYELARDSETAWKRNTAYAEAKLHKLAAQRGMDWEQMDEEARQDFVAELLRGGG